MKPKAIEQIEQLLKFEIAETQDIQAIYQARSGPLSDWGSPIKSIFFCNDEREVIGLNLADEEAFEEIEEEDIFTQFPELPHLQVLNLSRTPTWYYVNGDENCNERSDHKYGTDLEVFPFLEKLSNLHTFIHIGNKRLGCTCFLPNLPKLTHLYFNFNRIYSINWLQNLENTEFLDLQANVIRNIESLSKLKKLKHLYLGSPSNYKRQNKITDISPLENLTELAFLDLDGNPIQNLSPLKKLQKLKYLSLNAVFQPTEKAVNGGFGAYHVEVVGQERLDIPVYNLDFDLIDGLESLEKLLLINNDITDFDFLSRLKNLAYLDISMNPIHDLKAISALTNLTYLRMYDCNLSKFPLSEVLNRLNLLTRLDMSNNALHDISFLKNLHHLEELNIANNEVSDISILQFLPNLKKLDIANNPIFDISVLKHLPHLEHLKDSMHNSIKNLSYPPIWYVYLKMKKGKLGEYLPLKEPPYIEKIWQLLSSKDEQHKLLATQLAKGQNWTQEEIEIYQQLERQFY